MQLKPNEIHVWSTSLSITAEEEQYQFAVLSADEQIRAERFYRPLHKKRFIAARFMLRKILSLYLQAQPTEIQFKYGEQKKPALLFPAHTEIEFNVAHSDNLAVYAINRNYSIGIDIEKINDEYDTNIPQRFFSEQENKELELLSELEHKHAFYRIWARKEALLKATGHGLAIPLKTFSVSSLDKKETLSLDEKSWSLVSLHIDDGYQAALACEQTIKTVSHWRFFDHQAKLTNVSEF